MTTPVSAAQLREIQRGLSGAYTHAVDLYKPLVDLLPALIALAEERDLLKAASDFDSSEPDAEWESPHPIFRLAQERDRFMQERIDLQIQLTAQAAELEDYKAVADAAEGLDWGETLRDGIFADHAGSNFYVTSDELPVLRAALDALPGREGES